MVLWWSSWWLIIEFEKSWRWWFWLGGVRSSIGRGVLRSVGRSVLRSVSGSISGSVGGSLIKKVEHIGLILHKLLNESLSGCFGSISFCGGVGGVLLLNQLSSVQSKVVKLSFLLQLLQLLSFKFGILLLLLI